MKYIIASLAIAIIVSPVAAASIGQDLLELTGTYAVGDNPPAESLSTRTMVFTLPDSIQSITGLRFVASGSWTIGKILECRTIGEVTHCDSVPVSTLLTLRLTAESLGACHFQASTSAFNAVNANELLFEVCDEGSTDLNLLLDSAITAELFCDIEPGLEQFIIEATFGTLTVVRMETVGAVKNQQPTWGSMKAQYR